MRCRSVPHHAPPPRRKHSAATWDCRAWLALENLGSKTSRAICSLFRARLEQSRLLKTYAQITKYVYNMTFTSSSNCLTLILSPKPLFLAQVMLTSNSWVWCMRIASPLQWSSGTIGSQPQSLSRRVCSHQCSDAIIRDCWLANTCYISPCPLVVAFANSWMSILRSIIPAVLKAPIIPDV